VDAFEQPVNLPTRQGPQLSVEKRVIVVGAGMGGLAAALSLASRATVTVLERRNEAGGKMRDIAIDNRRIDVGPTVLTMKWVFEELFALAGADFDSFVPTVKLDTLARHAWRDGSRFDLLAEDKAAIDAVGDFAGADESRRFAKFIGDARRIHETLRDSFLCEPSPNMFRMMRLAGLSNLLKIEPFSSYWSALGRYFHDPRLRQLFARYATYCGSSPFSAPATLMIIAHVERAGVWAPEKGMAGLARACARLAADRGVNFRFGEHVVNVLVESGRVSGVETSSGERLSADAVIVNADISALALGRLGKHLSHLGGRSTQRPRSQSAMTFTVSAAATGYPLHRHNVFFSEDYKSEFDDVFKFGVLPRQPTTYIWAPVSEGPMFCLINAPPTVETASTQTDLDQGRARMIEQLSACGLKLEIKSETVMGPADFASDYPGTEGSLYGAPSHGWEATFQRPGVKSRLAGLYLAGGSVHPGPGVPMAALSGMAAARCLMNDFGLT